MVSSRRRLAFIAVVGFLAGAAPFLRVPLWGWGAAAALIGLSALLSRHTSQTVGRRRQAVVVLVVALLVAAPGVVVAAHITGTVPISGGIPLTTPNGMTVTVDGSTDALMEDSFTLSGTINVITEPGNATFFSSGTASATVDATNITGTFTNVTSISASSNTIQINPEDKQQVTVGGGIDHVAWRDATQRDDATVDFTYGGSGSDARVTLNNVSANTEIVAVDASTGNFLDVATSDGNGAITFDALTNSDHAVLLQTPDFHDPTFSNASPQGDQSSSPSQISVDVNDTDFPNGDSVDVTIDVDGSQEHTETITSNSTVTTSMPSSGVTGGAHTWTVNATDDFDDNAEQTFSYNIPNTLELFNETSPQTKITGQGTATIRSFGEGNLVIVNSTSNGEIDLTGFPVDQEFVVKVELADFHDTTVILKDIYQQQKLWLLNESISSNEVRFTLTDNTGDFSNDPRLYIERPLNHTGTNTTWEVIRADDFGAAGVTTNLETDTRYRLTVENTDGDQRSVGPYTTAVDETVTLTVGAASLNLSTNGTSYTFNGTFTEVSGTPSIVWGYNDPDENTSELTVRIYEFGNESNEIYDQTFQNPTDLRITQSLTADQANKSWTVDWSGTRGGESIGGKVTVGQLVDQQVSALPAWLQEALAILTLMLTAGLFTQRNFAMGSIVVALVGGAFWMGGWLTGITTGAGIAGALTLAILYKWARDVRR